MSTRERREACSIICFRILIIYPPPVGTILETVWSLKAHSAHLNISPSRALAMPIPLLITNAVATALVGAKVWYERTFDDGVYISELTPPTGPTAAISSDI